MSCSPQAQRRPSWKFIQISAARVKVIVRQPQCQIMEPHIVHFYPAPREGKQR